MQTLRGKARVPTGLCRPGRRPAAPSDAAFGGEPRSPAALEMLLRCDPISQPHGQERRVIRAQSDLEFAAPRGASVVRTHLEASVARGETREEGEVRRCEDSREHERMFPQCSDVGLRKIRYRALIALLGPRADSLCPDRPSAPVADRPGRQAEGHRGLRREPPAHPVMGISHVYLGGRQVVKVR